jgi:hypothetical protein
VARKKRNRSASERRIKFRNKKGKYVLLAGMVGDPCPRCGGITEVHQHAEVTERHLTKQPYYYSRWFACMNPRCKTTLIMPERYRVYRNPVRPPLEEEFRIWTMSER